VPEVPLRAREAHASRALPGSRPGPAEGGRWACGQRQRDPDHLGQAPGVRPLLKPALRRLWRDPATLQLGLDPAHSVVLYGVQADDASLLDLLDGSRDLAELGAEADRRGHDSSRVQLLIETLGAAAALDDAPTRLPRDGRRTPDLLSLSLQHRAPGAAAAVMTHREATTVEIVGAGRVGSGIAALLAAAGIGRLEINDPGALRSADLSPGGVRSAGSRLSTRAEAARLIVGAAGEHSAGGGTKRARTGAAEDQQIGASPSEAIVVLAPPAGVMPPEWLAAVRHHPHLPVVIRETTAVIGPFVLPGRTPCLRCVELTRGDRDPAWPALAAQLIGQAHGVEPCDVALASAAASIVALHVLAAVDGAADDGTAVDGAASPPSVGGVLELSLRDLRLRRRTVTAHPGCGCGAAPLSD
jgi:bacteriocin biosynthesis cyclodehydratase domain-containing protein